LKVALNTITLTPPLTVLVDISFMTISLRTCDEGEKLKAEFSDFSETKENSSVEEEL
jgi:hypothetical protein